MSGDQQSGVPKKIKTPPEIPAKPKELKARYGSRPNSRQQSPAAESLASRESSQSTHDLRGLSSSVESLTLIEKSSRPIPDNYYGKQAVNRLADAIVVESHTVAPTTSAVSPPPLPPRGPVRIDSYYGQSASLNSSTERLVVASENVAVDPTTVVESTIVSSSTDSTPMPAAPRAPLPPIPAPMATIPPPPTRLDFSGPKNLVLQTKNTNHKPPAIEGPPTLVKRGLASLSIDTDFICIGGSSCVILSTHDYEELWSKSTDKITSAVQVEQEVWLGTRDGRICIVDPTMPGYVEENGKHHRRAITNLWYDDGLVIALGGDGKVSVWNPRDFKTPMQVHRVAPGFKCATYSSPFLWVMKGRQVFVYDPLLKKGSFLVLPHALEYGARTTSTVGEYSCGCAAPQNGLTVLGHNDGTISLYRDLAPVATVNLGYSGVLSITKAGPYHWIGLRTGKMLVVDISDKEAVLLKEWAAQSGPVSLLATCEGSGLVLSGSLNEPVKAWESSLYQDKRELEARKKRDASSVFKNIRVQVFTWNVGCAHPQDVNDHVFWRELNPKSAPDLVVFGLQEVVELDNHSKTAKTMMKIEEEMQAEHKEWRRFWSDLLEGDYELVTDRGLVGLYSCVFVSSKYFAAISNVSSTVVKTGFGGLHGNKGGTIIQLDLFDSSLSFVNVHLAAGQSGALQRNKDAEMIIKGGVDSGVNPGRRPLDHDYCFFFGDTNYRINTVRENANKLISTKSWDKLYSYDQLGKQLTKNPMFVLAGFHEMPIAFPPTYKFDVGSNRYDSSDKQRIPSWCDRVLYRGEDVKPVVYDSLDALESDHRPVMALFSLKLKLYSPHLERV